MKLLFLHSTGLGDHSVEAGEFAEVQDSLALQFIAEGRATVAPDEPAPVPPTAVTTLKTKKGGAE